MCLKDTTNVQVTNQRLKLSVLLRLGGMDNLKCFYHTYENVNLSSPIINLKKRPWRMASEIQAAWDKLKNINKHLSPQITEHKKNLNI